MDDNRRYLRWCLNQSKGIRIVKPSENLVRAYSAKSRNALKSMEINANAGLDDWAVSTSYYAKYLAVYALLAKIGAKCEIHDCTIALFEHLFGNSVPKELIEELKRSKEDRIETQYYTREIDVDLEQLVKKTKKFVLDIEQIADGLNSERTITLQKRLKSMAVIP